MASARPGGLAAFNVIELEHVEAIVAGAEAADRPVVLQISENTVGYHGALAPLALACRCGSPTGQPSRLWCTSITPSVRT